MITFKTILGLKISQKKIRLKIYPDFFKYNS